MDAYLQRVSKVLAQFQYENIIGSLALVDDEDSDSNETVN
jgi:hypothetical protein